MTNTSESPLNAHLTLLTFDLEQQKDLHQVCWFRNLSLHLSTTEVLACNMLRTHSSGDIDIDNAK